MDVEVRHGDEEALDREVPDEEEVVEEVAVAPGQVDVEERRSELDSPIPTLSTLTDRRTGRVGCESPVPRDPDGVGCRTHESRVWGKDLIVRLLRLVRL